MGKPDTKVPAKVPEVVHPVPPPVNTKPTLATVEPKRPINFSNGQMPFPNSKKVSVDRSVPVCSATQRNSNNCHPSCPLSSHSSCSLNSNVDSRDINELVNYIEGNKSVDKAALAQKKAAKKARQRMKKTYEREQAETEQLKEEVREEKHKEGEQLLAEKQKKIQDDKMQQKQNTKKNGKKQGKNSSENAFTKEFKQSNVIAETISAMVTIKCVAEGSNSPATITITLKGSTPESDKLLFTLVNGHNNKEHVATVTINTDSTTTKSKADSISIKLHRQNITSKAGSTDNRKNAKKKKETNDTAAKELEVPTIPIDKNNVSRKDLVSKQNSKSKAVKNNKEAENKTSQSLNSVKDDINQLVLSLSPGITITKIEGPPITRNCKASNCSASTQNMQNLKVPVSKFGMIVVDTEKLTQQPITANNNKKNKKKRDKKIGNPETDGSFINRTNQNGAGSPMVTLKNPLFHTLQTALCNKAAQNSDLPVYQNNQQASIFTNENGMVTIRSPRLQNPLKNGSPISNFLTDLKPVPGPEDHSSYVPIRHNNFQESSKKLSSNMQDILSGLPGIEITKVDKTSSKNKHKNKKSLPAAEVSIIRTSTVANSEDKFNLDKDWPFEGEEGINAEDQRLEAFKRFCQQSASPERKEKVAHPNAKDNILKKKKKKKKKKKDVLDL